MSQYSRIFWPPYRRHFMLRRDTLRDLSKDSMITRVRIKNFRNLADIDVQLGPLTVLVGRNGAGKSTFLDALRFVRDALENGLDMAISQRGGIEVVRRKSSRGRTYDIEIILELTEGYNKIKYSFALGTGQQEQRRIKHESLQIMTASQISGNFVFETRAGKWVVLPISVNSFSNQDQLSKIPVSPDTLMLLTLSNLFAEFEVVFNNITAASYYCIFPNTLRTLQRQTSVTLLSEDGKNLSTTLRSIIKNGRFNLDLVTALVRIIDGVQDIRVAVAGGYLVTYLKHETQDGRSFWLPLDQESDGTLRVLALLAALYQETPHALIAIEEPELSIHPGALAMLSEVIEEAATRSQVIIATQSPDLISRFSVDQLRVVEMVDGDTYIGPIEEGQREAINEQLFSAGDLLRIEGLHVSQRESTTIHA